MAEKKIYPDGIKPETAEFKKRQEIKKIVDEVIKKVAKEKTYKAFKDLGFEQKEDYYFVYAKNSESESDKEKAGGRGSQEGKVNVTISYPKKYSGDDSSAPLVSNMQKITSFGGKRLLSEIYINIKGNILEISYKNTEDSGFHQQSDGPTYAPKKLEKDISIPNITDSKNFKKQIEKMFEEICKAEAEYLSGTKISQDDKIEKKQNASTVMENKFKMTLQSLLEGDVNEIGEEIQRQVKESIEEKPINVDTDEGEKELLKGDVKKEEKDSEEEVNEITTTPGGIASAFGGDVNPTDNQATSAGGSFPTLAGTKPNEREFSNAAKGENGEVVANQDNSPKNYRVNEEVSKTPYGEMHAKRGRMVKEDGTYSVKVDMEPGYLNVPKGMEKNGENPESGFVLGMHDKAEVNSKEELAQTGHGDTSQINEAYNRSVRLNRKKFVSNEETNNKGLNKRQIISEELSKKDLHKRFKQLIETKSFEGIKEDCSIVDGGYDKYANEKFTAENPAQDTPIESDFDSTPAGGCEDGFELVPKTATSLIMFKLAEADLKADKAFIKDYFTNKIVPNPRYKTI